MLPLSLTVLFVNGHFRYSVAQILIDRLGKRTWPIKLSSCLFWNLNSKTHSYIFQFNSRMWLPGAIQILHFCKMFPSIEVSSTWSVIMMAECIIKHHWTTGKWITIARENHHLNCTIPWENCCAHTKRFLTLVGDFDRGTSNVSMDILITSMLITSCVSGRGNIFDSVHLCVCPFALCRLNRWTNGPKIWRTH